jgi:Lon protease-like protein
MAPYRPPARDLARVLRALPVLVHSQAVLFPGARLSLVVREPSQLGLLREVVASHRVLAIVPATLAATTVQAGLGARYVAGVGTILEYARVAGGRQGLVILGRDRVQLRACSLAGPHARAQATVLPSLDSEVPAAELAALHEHARRFVALVRRREPAFRFRLPRSSDPGVVADGCAHALLLDPRERQRVLETLDVRERVQRVVQSLAAQCCTLEHDGGADDGQLN